ncbi:MAG TPA: FAD-dependent oxidoreductase [Candidatus Tyrphobacter sp.]
MKPRVLVLGAGFAGHTAALHLSRHLDEVDVTVVSPSNRFTWFPSLIWVGVGTISPDRCHFALDGVYDRIGIRYVAGRAQEIDLEKRSVSVACDAGDRIALDYDFLINATGPYLNFDGTPGLGPSAANSESVCSIEHATHTRDAYLDVVKTLRKGGRARIVVGTGHPLATCEGAAFEYIMNVDHDLRRRALRERAELIWLSNESQPGDFGVDGVEARRSERIVRGADVIGGLFAERGIRAILPAGTKQVESGRLLYETPAAEPAWLEFDFAMLIPQFRGIPLKYVSATGEDRTPQMTQPNGLMSVDADYSAKTYPEYRAKDWPSIYRSPYDERVYAAGIAFAPPHALSKTVKSATGAPITATAPRTGMASGIIGRTVALNVLDQVRGGEPCHREPMTAMPAACIASMGNSLITGSAASIIMVPVARDYERYPEFGRDLALSDLEVGLSGAWTKRLLHDAFMWKLQARPGWQYIPE